MPNITCERCNGSGSVGYRGPYLGYGREAPGPVPEEARGWNEAECPNCGGAGEFYEYTDPYDPSGPVQLIPINRG